MIIEKAVFLHDVIQHMYPYGGYVYKIPHHTGHLVLGVVTLHISSALSDVNTLLDGD